MRTVHEREENTITIVPTATSSPTPPLEKKSFTIPTPTPLVSEWGVAKQIGSSTWTMRIEMDPRMATPQEVLEALNEYRRRHQKEALTWDSKLADYATTRAQYFTNQKKLDAHIGFVEFTKSIDNVKSLGFWSLGENASYGYQVYGVHLIEWVYAGDEPHNTNQLNSQWTHVGIGIVGNQTDMIFGGNKM